MSLSSTDQELVKVAVMGVGIIVLRAAAIILVGMCVVLFERLGFSTVNPQLRTNDIAATPSIRHEK